MDKREEERKDKWKNIKTLFWIILVAIVGFFYFTRNQTVLGPGYKTTTASFNDMGQPLSSDIVNCEFKVISNFVYQNENEAWSDKDRKVYYSTSEEKPNLITFTDLSSKQPKIKGNMGDDLLTRLKDDEDTIVLLEKNMLGDIFTYTIFKKEKIATWYKSYKMITAPYSMLSMGYCY